MAQEITAKFVFSHPIHFLSCGFGTGLLPKAPGTWGSLAAIPLFFILSYLSPWIYFSTVVLLTVFGIYCCGYTSKALGVHDHQAIVWDEIAGILLTYSFMPLTALNILLGFVLFRVFDIVKPWPIRVIDAKVSGGLGIMLDDVLAAGFAWLVLQAIIQLSV